MKFFTSWLLVYLLAFPPFLAVAAEPGGESGSQRAADPAFGAVSGRQPGRAVYSALVAPSRRVRYSGSSGVIGAIAMRGPIPAVAIGSQLPSSEVGKEQTPIGDSPFGLSMIADVEYALGTGRGKSQKGEAVFEPKLTATLPFGLKLTGVGRLRADAFDELEPGKPRPQEVASVSRRAQIGDQGDAEVRELYLEAAFGESYLKIGKQQIVWGESDGLKVLDVVNPQDFREFILPNFDDSRIPLWTVNAEIPIKNWALQLLFIPDPTGNELAEPGSVFEVTSNKLIPPPPPGVRVQMLEADRPARLISDSDAGFRLSTFAGGFDVTLNYLYKFDDFPVLRRTLTADERGPKILLQPEFERTTLLGTTFSTARGNFTVRGELGYNIDKFLSVADPQDFDGVARVNELSYVLGLDYFGFENNVLSGQFFQSSLSSGPTGLLRDRLETNFTFVWRREMLSNALRFEVIWLLGLNENDGLVRPELRYEIRDDLAIRAGVDFFYGDKDGMFGQFGQADRVVLGVELGF